MLVNGVSTKYGCRLAFAAYISLVTSWWMHLERSLDRARARVVDPARDRYWAVADRFLPRKLAWQVWAAAVLLFCVPYVLMWSVVHVHIDMRPCAFALDDPLFHVIAYDPRWFWVTHQVYSWITISALAVFVANAVLGDHRPLVVWGASLGLQAILRSTTLLLLPLCRVTVAPGSRALTETPLLNLGLVSIPWRVWATNDMMFSGHVGEFLLLYWCTRQWPKGVRSGLLVFQIVQIYGLLATRGHYTIDVVLAVPCALLEFRLALWGLLHAAGVRQPAVARA